MKKIGIVLFLIIAFLIIYFLQANVFNYLTIAGVKPNLFIIFILFIGLFASTSYGIILGVIFGLIIDLIYGKSIGLTAVMLCAVGYLGGYFDKSFSKENKITIILMIAGATIIFEIGHYLLNSLITGFAREYIYFAKILAIETIYNILLTIILYPLIQKIGYSIDRVFKRKNILTRYF